MDPMALLGVTDVTVGMGPAPVTVHVPAETSPVVLALVSTADNQTVSLPAKPGWNVMETTAVRTFPATVTELPEPFKVHWLFCALPPLGLTNVDPVEAISLASANWFDAAR